jgi:hypothetical protein
MQITQGTRVKDSNWKESPFEGQEVTIAFKHLLSSLMRKGQDRPGIRWGTFPSYWALPETDSYPTRIHQGHAPILPMEVLRTRAGKQGN